MSGRVVIIGGGLTGLSAAWHLGSSAVLLEASRAVGGLCRSHIRGGYTFDLSGHLLHFRRPLIKSLVEDLLDGNLAEHRRRAFIRFGDRLIRYPFQAHLSELPAAVRDECLAGFLEAPARRGKAARAPRDFAGWVRFHFGTGIARHFLEPYNRKLWRVPLSRLVADWASWAVPVPTTEQIREAADPARDVTMGYNAVFSYPKRGGIDVLAGAMAEKVAHLHLGQRVVAVDPRRRRVDTAAGRRFEYESLISTMPLPELLRITRGLSPSLTEAAEELACVPVCVFNVGLSRPGPPEPHWIYYPGGDVPFYRVGFMSNFAPGNVPPGCHSLYVETSLPPGEEEGCRDLWPPVRAGLEAVGLLGAGEEPAVLDVVHIPCAYVVYDARRARVLPRILDELALYGIHSIGRYGAWEYSAMEDAIHQGRERALQLRRRDGREGR